MFSPKSLLIASMLLILIVIEETLFYRHVRSFWASTFNLIDESGKDITDMSTSITVDRQRVIRIDPASIKDSKGRPAKIDGKPQWSQAKDGNFSLFPSDDGFSCAVLGINPTADGETIQVSASIDADLGAGTKLVTKSTDFTCTPGQASDFGLVVGDETDPA